MLYVTECIEYFLCSKLGGGGSLPYICFYQNKTPLDNNICNQCSLYLVTCMPTASDSGYSHGECDCFLCSGCNRDDCFNKELINI